MIRLTIFCVGKMQTWSGLTGADAIAAHASTLLRSYWGPEASPAAVQPWAGATGQCTELPPEHKRDDQHASPDTDGHQPAQASETYMVSG